MQRRLSVAALGAALFLATSPILATEHSSDAEAQRAVLVTGATSGIGRKITETLAANGYYVYAGARDREDLRDLNAIDNVEAVRLDVTVARDIRRAVEQVKQGGRGLYGLVNNAGVAVLAPLIEVDEKEMDFVFDVNVYGPFRVTKAFAPLLIESEGRITNISSISGVVSGALYGPYSMTKHALEAYSEALGAELARFNVQVSAVQPGSYKSNIGQSFCERLATYKQRYQTTRFAKEMNAATARCRADTDGARDEPDAVAEAVMHSLFDDAPKTHYMVVPNARQARATVGQAMNELVALNQDQEFAYDREKLIAMLDERLTDDGEEPVERLQPVVRHSMLVTDLDRSLKLYRDILGLNLNRVNETSANSYSYTFFDIPKGAMKRFAYLDAEDGRENAMGLGEVPGLDLKKPKKPRSVAWVQTVADVEATMRKVQALGLELIPPVEFQSREAGKTGIETGTVDWDGHLVMFYGLKNSEAK